MQNEEHSQRKNEDDPAGKSVKEALPFLGIPILHHKPSSHDPQAISYNCYGNRGDNQSGFPKISGLCEVPINDRQSG